MEDRVGVSRVRISVSVSIWITQMIQHLFCILHIADIPLSYISAFHILQLPDFGQLRVVVFLKWYFSSCYVFMVALWNRADHYIFML